MSYYRLRQTIDNLQAIATQAVSLGGKAITDVIEACCRDDSQITLTDVKVSKLSAGWHISLTLYSRHNPTIEPQKHEFLLPATYGTTLSWPDIVAGIRHRQKALSPHLAGPAECTDDQSLYDLVRDKIIARTGYDGLAYDDLAVGRQANCLWVCPITRAGEIAFHKYLELAKLEHQMPNFCLTSNESPKYPGE